MNTDGTGVNTCKKCHKTESVSNHTTIDHKEGEQLEDRRNVGESSCNFGDGTDQRVKSLITNNFLCITHTVEHNYISSSSTLGLQLHVSALYVGHLQVVT